MELDRSEGGGAAAGELAQGRAGGGGVGLQGGGTGGPGGAAGRPGGLQHTIERAARRARGGPSSARKSGCADGSRRFRAGLVA